MVCLSQLVVCSEGYTASPMAERLRPEMESPNEACRGLLVFTAATVAVAADGCAVPPLSLLLW